MQIKPFQPLQRNDKGSNTHSGPKFNRLNNRFYTALSILHDATAELPQKGNTADECQKVSLICAINDLEAKLNGVCIDDFINKKFTSL